jgi:hypothetical protein
LLASVENSSFGQTVTVPIAFDALPPVAPELDVAALRANILDSQEWFPGTSQSAGKP